MLTTCNTFVDDLFADLLQVVRFYVVALTELTVGDSNEADIVTPTNERVLPHNTDNATPAPDGNEINMPTHKPRVVPL